MKRYLCLIGAMLAAAATPALASEARPSAPTAPVAAQRTADHQVMSEQVRQGLSQLRETLEARKREAKQRSAAAQNEAGGLCSDCPQEGRRGPSPFRQRRAQGRLPRVHRPRDLSLMGCGAVRVTSHRTAPLSRPHSLHFYI